MVTTVNKGSISAQTEVESVNFNCLAPKGKYYKCRATIVKVETSMPYEIKRTVTLYSGKKVEKVIKSNFEGLMSGSITYERCCFKNCDPEIENVCADWVKDSNNSGFQCPKLEGLTDGTVPPTKEEIVKLEDKFDPLVIADIKVILGAASSCPHGYFHVTENDTSDKADFDYATFDLNKRFVCVLKKKVSKLETAPINVIRVSKNNKDCGTLNQVNTSLTDPAETYLCYGNDPSIKSAPLKEIKLITENFRKDRKTSRYYDDFECDPVLIKDMFHFCLLIEKNAPKKVQVIDFKYDFTQMNKHLTGPPKKVKEVIVSSATLTETVKVIKRSETSLKLAVDMGISVGVSLEVRLYGFSSGVGYNYKTKITKTLEENKAEEAMNTTTVDCIAQDY
jgi:hypothetical protein